jgi:hypothetical protein
MSESLQSILIGTSALSAVAIVSLLLTIAKKPKSLNSQDLDQFVKLVLIGVAFQCIHFVEEFITHLYERLPQLLGLQPWSAEFFVTFNLSWVFIWILSAVGLKYNFRPAFFPVWFFAIGMTGNGIAHPALALAVGGYFPGLFTSPIVGVLGVMLLLRLWRLH